MRVSSNKTIYLQNNNDTCNVKLKLKRYMYIYNRYKVSLNYLNTGDQDKMRKSMYRQKLIQTMLSNKKPFFHFPIIVNTRKHILDAAKTYIIYKTMLKQNCSQIIYKTKHSKNKKLFASILLKLSDMSIQKPNILKVYM